MAAGLVPTHVAVRAALGRSSLAELTDIMAQPAVAAFDRALSMGRAPAGGRGWARVFRAVLQDNILPFWIEHGVDREHGGMFGWLDRHGRPRPPGTKSIVPQMRSVWLLANACRTLQPVEPAYGEVAANVLEFVRARFWDRRRGGYYWWVDREGRLVDDRKHLYGQACAMFGLAEYGRAFQDDAALHEALEVFEVLERHARDEVGGGYFQVFSCDWRELLEGDRYYGAPGGKHQNHHIGMLQGLLALYEATGEPRVRRRLDEVVDVFVQRFIHPELGYIRLHFSHEWRFLGPDVSSYGHDIELSWLLVAAARALGRLDHPDLRRAALALAAHTLEYGFDRRRGGVFWEGVPAGPVTSRRKVWWVQAEALVGLLGAHELGGEARFREAFERQARYVWRHCIDHRHGEWFEWAGPIGQVLGAKASFWKDAFHQGRACLEVSRRLDARPVPD